MGSQIEPDIKFSEDDDSIKIIDLCSGTGAFSIAFKKASHESNKTINTIFANDNCDKAGIIFKKNFKNVEFNSEDLNDLDVKLIPKHDILTAGFSCQPFSVAGKKLGFEDPRSNVFWSILNIIKYHTPRIVLFENVKNLKTHDKGRTFKTITSSLEKINYKFKYKILNTSEYSGLPHNRERIYIICFRNEEDYNNFNFDNIKKEQKQAKISSFIQDNVDEKYYYTDRLKVYKTINESVIKNVKTHNTIYQYRRYYVRENKSNVCPTLTANMGSGGHNVPLIKTDMGIRKLTPRECFNLQGFDTSYELVGGDSSLYKLAGNCVSIPVVEKIAQEILTLF